MAYWINLYNALTIKVILDHYPVESIWDIDISPGIFADGPWGRKLMTIEGETVSLDDIEHQIPSSDLEGSAHSLCGQLRLDRLSKPPADAVRG